MIHMVDIYPSLAALAGAPLGKNKPLAKYPSASTNLADQNPDKVNELQAWAIDLSKQATPPLFLMELVRLGSRVNLGGDLATASTRSAKRPHHSRLQAKAAKNRSRLPACPARKIGFVNCGELPVFHHCLAVDDHSPHAAAVGGIDEISHR